MGRNKFGYQRGPWTDEEWQGWWGDNPPFHIPVVVLTHHVRPVLEMQGGTTFHFVDKGPAEALDLARELACGLDVRIGGGVSTVRQFLLRLVGCLASPQPQLEVLATGQIDVMNDSGGS